MVTRGGGLTRDRKREGAICLSRKPKITPIGGEATFYRVKYAQFQHSREKRRGVKNINQEDREGLKKINTDPGY